MDQVVTFAKAEVVVDGSEFTVQKHIKAQSIRFMENTCILIIVWPLSCVSH